MGCSAVDDRGWCYLVGIRWIPGGALVSGLRHAMPLAYFFYFFIEVGSLFLHYCNMLLWSPLFLHFRCFTFGLRPFLGQFTAWPYHTFFLTSHIKPHHTVPYLVFYIYLVCHTYPHLGSPHEIANHVIGTPWSVFLISMGVPMYDLSVESVAGCSWVLSTFKSSPGSHPGVNPGW